MPPETSADVGLAVVCDPRFHAHSPPGFHPERPRRLEAAELGESNRVLAAEGREDVRLAGGIQAIAAPSPELGAEFEIARITLDPSPCAQGGEHAVVLAKLAENCIVLLPKPSRLVELAAREVDQDPHGSR